MRDEELEQKLVRMVIDGTGSPAEALTVIGSAHMAILRITLKWLKDNQGKEAAAELSAEHFDLVLRTLAAFTDELGLQDGTIQKMLGKIKKKLDTTDPQVGNFKTFIEVLDSQPKAGNKKTGDGSFQQLVSRDWNFKFPIPAWVQGKHVTLDKSPEVSLKTAETPAEIDGALFHDQFQLVDQNKIQYLAYLCKKKEEYPLYIVKKGVK